MRNVLRIDVKGGEGGDGGVQVIAEADVDIAHVAFGHIEFAPLGKSLKEGPGGNQETRYRALDGRLREASE